MAIARVASQAAGTTFDVVTWVARATPGNVTAGNLLVVLIECWTNTTNRPPVVGDISKTAGTATVGTWALDRVYTLSASGEFIHTAIFSAPVTGTGSCTVTVANFPTGSSGAIGVQEYTGADVSSTRVADSNQGSGTTGAPATANMSSTEDAAFVGALATITFSATTHTPDAAFATIYEEEDGANHQTGSLIDQIVAGATTDAASWTAPTTFAWVAAGVVYKGAAAGGAAINHFLSMLGVGI
jgi:hypothetical protein